MSDPFLQAIMRKISWPKRYTEDTFYNANLTNLRQTNNPLQGEIG